MENADVREPQDKEKDDGTDAHSEEAAADCDNEKELEQESSSDKEDPDRFPTKAETAQKAVQSLQVCECEWISCSLDNQCCCQNDIQITPSERPDSNWHLVAAWGHIGNTALLRQLKSGKKYKKTGSANNVKKMCFPTYFRHHQDISKHMDDYTKFKLKHFNPARESAKEEVSVLPDLSTTCIQMVNLEDPHLSKLANSKYVFLEIFSVLVQEKIFICCSCSILPCMQSLRCTTVHSDFVHAVQILLQRCPLCLFPETCLSDFCF